MPGSPKDYMLGNARKNSVKKDNETEETKNLDKAISDTVDELAALEGGQPTTGTAEETTVEGEPAPGPDEGDSTGLAGKIAEMEAFDMESAESIASMVKTMPEFDGMDDESIVKELGDYNTLANILNKIARESDMMAEAEMTTTEPPDIGAMLAGLEGDPAGAGGMV